MSRILFISLFFTCYNLSAQTKEFSLTGKTSGIEDGTFLYFRDLVNGGNLDSAVVKNNSFRFTTVLPEPTLFVMLFTKDKSNFTELWLENNPMTFDASEGDFRQAKVTGSEDQILFRKMREEVRVDFPETDKEIIKQREIEFMKSHPDALVSAYLLYGNRRLNQDETRESFPDFLRKYRDLPWGKEPLNICKERCRKLEISMSIFASPTYMEMIRNFLILKKDLRYCNSGLRAVGSVET